MPLNWKTLGLALAGGIVLEAGIYLLTWGINAIMREPKKRKDTYFTTLFFPDNKVACKNHFTNRHGCTRSVCNFSHDKNSSYGQLLCCLSSARRQVDVAVYCITGKELVSVLVELHQVGVIIRVITDNEQLEQTASQIGYLRAEGIQVRHDYKSFYMHHKFAIIDGEVLLNGSFNWTKNAIMGNNENVIITNQKDVIQAYQSEYEKLWQEFDPKQNV